MTSATQDEEQIYQIAEEPRLEFLHVHEANNNFSKVSGLDVSIFVSSKSPVYQSLRSVDIGLKHHQPWTMWGTIKRFQSVSVHSSTMKITCSLLQQQHVCRNWICEP